MSRKETESEQEVASKWKKVDAAKADYNESLLPPDPASPQPRPAPLESIPATGPRPSRK